MSDENPSPAAAVRNIPLPASISEAAREKLTIMVNMSATGRPPKPETIADWDAMIQFADQMLLSVLAKPASDTKVERISLGGVQTYDITPHNRVSDKVFLFLHGGALTMGAGEVCGAIATSLAENGQIRTLGVDYRMPPHHPYPAPLDDCVAAYRALLEQHDPADIVVGGQSAGGNLAGALILRARDEGLPMPAAVILLTPEIDLTESGDSFETLMGADPVLTARLTDTIELYAGGHDLSDPYLSPLFGDFSKGFPRTFLQCGTRDLFLSNTVRFHRELRRHGISADLHVFEAMPHGGFGSMLEGGLGSAPEDQEVYAELRRFLASLS